MFIFSRFAIVFCASTRDPRPSDNKLTPAHRRTWNTPQDSTATPHQYTGASRKAANFADLTTGENLSAKRIRHLDCPGRTGVSPLGRESLSNDLAARPQHRCSRPGALSSVLTAPGVTAPLRLAERRYVFHATLQHFLD
ncbi:hypothetical protein EYF80_038347 [Liparis tanakae]|uniref:Uncharacterized protein n=1 Tax=Liparis tanakae TaxID=230148 RepID=A0A4Z2GE65_9TELE|nr:hypothetical protein EYF80_038347 [Liparis tanakae]